MDCSWLDRVSVRCGWEQGQGENIRRLR
jgi:hypothetical protein